MDLMKKIDEAVKAWRGILDGFEALANDDRLRVAMILSHSASMAQRALRCEMLDADGKSCNNPLAECAECVRLTGAKCELYEPRKGKCKSCGGK